MMGSVLLQPQRVRRVHARRQKSPLIGDLALLLTRLARDTHTGGRIAALAREALESAFERIAAERTARIEAAGPRIVQRLTQLLQSITGVDGAAQFEVGADALVLGGNILEHIANGLDGISAAELRPHVALVLDLLETDLGFSLAEAQTELWRILDDVIARLEGAPAESDVRAHETRLETACVLRQLRRILRDFPLPRLDADRISVALAAWLQRVQAPRAAAQLRCAALALKAGAQTGQSITELVTLPAFSQFRNLGAAAAAASDEKFCWYATWLFGDAVVINKERTEIRRGSAVVKTGTDLTLEDIPGFRPPAAGATNPAPFYRFGTYWTAERMETAAFVSAISSDAVIILFHAISLEEGDFASNLLNMMFPLVYGGGKLHSRSMLMPLWVEDWIIPPLMTTAASLEGIHTNAKPAGYAVLMWLALFAADFLEERLYRGYAKTGHNGFLTFLTLYNHKEPPPVPPTALGPNPVPLPSPENYKVVGGFADIVGFLTAIIVIALIPREDWGLQDTNTDDNNYGLILGWWLGASTLCALFGRVAGGLLAWPIAGKAAPAQWFTHRWWMLFEHWTWHLGFLYWFMDGNTDGGRYNSRSGQPAYNGFADHKTSPYSLPYTSGLSAYIVQGNQGLFSHNKLNGNQIYAYDFALDMDEEILAARPGTVVDWFDFVPNNQEVTTAATPNPPPPAPPITVVGQTTSASVNFIVIRHDADEDAAGNPAPMAANAFNNAHDRVAGVDTAGDANLSRTYATYLHGRQGSVQAAFASRGIQPGNIIGQVVRRGEWIMGSGNTGVSFLNHLHFAVRPGPDVGTAPPITRGSLGDEVPTVFRDVENFPQADGEPNRLNWYTSSTTRVP